MPRTSNTELRRAQIVRGLEKVMATTGYECASVVAIAEAAGLAPGLVHYHFQTKQEILVELVRDLGQRLAQRCEDAVRRAAGNGPRARLEAWLDAHVALGHGADPTAVACWVAVGAEANRLAEVQAVFAQALLDERKQLCVLLAAAVAPKRVAVARLNAMAAALLAAIQGAYLVGVAAPDIGPRGFAKPALRAMLDGLLSSLDRS